MGNIENIEWRSVAILAAIYFGIGIVWYFIVYEKEYGFWKVVKILGRNVFCG